MTSLLEGG